MDSHMLQLSSTQTSTLLISLSTDSIKVCSLIHLLLLFLFDDVSLTSADSWLLALVFWHVGPEVKRVESAD